MLPRSPQLRAGLRMLGFLIAGLTFVGMYLIPLWKAPTFLLNQDLMRDPNTRPEHRLSAEHNARLIVISIGGALVVLAGLLYTARGYRLAHRGQVTERFTKALERLGSDELYVRAGGVHALERVMRDSPDHHGDVVEVLAAFIRERAPRRTQDAAVQEGWMHPPIGTDPAELPTEPAADVQTALTALARRPKRVALERGLLDLRELHLRGAYLDKAQLQDALLDHAQLQDAFLMGAHLEGAHLFGAQLQGANLVAARLQDAFLMGAQFEGALMVGARFAGAVLDQAQLQRDSPLVDANVEGALLMVSQPQRPYLAGAKLKNALLLHARIQRSLQVGPQLRGARMVRDHLLAGHRDGAALTREEAELAEGVEQEPSSIQGNGHEASESGTTTGK